MAAPTYKSGRIWAPEVRFKVDPVKVKDKELTVEVALHMLADKKDPAKGAIRLDLLIAGQDQSLDAFVRIQMVVQSSSGDLSSMPTKVRAAIARRLYDKARTILATLSDQMGFPPLILSSDAMDVEGDLQATREDAAEATLDRRLV